MRGLYLFQNLLPCMVEPPEMGAGNAGIFGIHGTFRISVGRCGSFWSNFTRRRWTGNFHVREGTMMKIHEEQLMCLRMMMMMMMMIHDVYGDSWCVLDDDDEDEDEGGEVMWTHVFHASFFPSSCQLGFTSSTNRVKIFNPCDFFSAKRSKWDYLIWKVLSWYQVGCHF